MPSKSIVVLGVAAAVAVSIGAGVAARSADPDPASEQRAERLYTDAHRREARVTQAEAVRLALAARPGTVVESHLQTEGDGLRWEVKTDDGTHRWEVQLDPSSGAIVGNQPEE